MGSGLIGRGSGRRIGAVLALASGLAACGIDASTFGPAINGGGIVGTPKNAIERALATCPTKTEAAETACVRQALVEGHLGPAALASLLPGCRVGATCVLAYRTRDRHGVLAATASLYVADWRVTFDLKSAKAQPADLPFTVAQS